MRNTIFNEINMGMNLTAIKNEKSVLLCGNQLPFSDIIKMLQLFNTQKTVIPSHLAISKLPILTDIY